jgi:hypothetical protein
MGNRLGLRLEHGLADRTSVEQIERDRLGAERPQVVCARRRYVGADHLVASVDQLRDESGADRTARSCDEYTHRGSPFGHTRSICGVYGYDP